MTTPRPTVCHVVDVAGEVSANWIDAQIRDDGGYDTRLVSLRSPATPYHWDTPAEPIASLGGGPAASTRMPRVLTDVARLVRSVASHELDADLYHAHFGPVGYHWSGVARRRQRPLVVSFYGFDATVDRHQRFPWTARYAQLLREAAAVLVEGPRMAERIHGFGAPADCIHTVRLPLPRSTGGDLPSRGEPSYDVFLGGRLVPKKGFAVALRAVASSMPADTTVAVAGDGPLRDDLGRLAADLGLAGRVDFLGALPVPAFTAAMTSSRVAVFPSVRGPDGDSEGGAPMSIPLAHRLGIPVVVSDHDDLPHAAAPGTPVAPAGDPRALGDAIRAVLIDRGPAETDRAVASAGAWAEAEHDPDHLLKLREAVYDEVIP